MYIGIGGALLINNILYDGISFDAGDFGHHVICSGIIIPCNIIEDDDIKCTIYIYFFNRR